MPPKDLPKWTRVRLTSTFKTDAKTLEPVRASLGSGEIPMVGATWVTHNSCRFLLSGFIGLDHDNDAESVHVELSASRPQGSDVSSGDKDDSSDEPFIQALQVLDHQALCRAAVSYPIARPKDYVIPLPMPVSLFGVEGFTELRGVRLAKLAPDGTEEYSAILDGDASTGWATIYFSLDLTIGLDAFLQAAEKASRLLRLALSDEGEKE